MIQGIYDRLSRVSPTVQATTYDAAAIEVLSGLEPVRKRPGMYTDTSRPNHLLQEVIDNSVDEALAGHADSISVVLYADGSAAVTDNGRGMPVDMHPQEGVPGVEVILTRLHAGGKFSNKNYQFAGGLHGVGVSVVNALSAQLDATVWRGGREYQMRFAQGNKQTELTAGAEVAKRRTGTQVRFWPEARFFDTPSFHLPSLQHLLRAKAVLCRGLKVRLTIETPATETNWFYEAGLSQYLHEACAAALPLPAQPFTGQFSGEREAVEWALYWLPEGGAGLNESYVNLIPTVSGGTHVNGLRTGLTEGLREFCELRDLLPRGLKLAPEDVWDNLAYVLSVRLQEAQFTGQTKERLSSREAATFVGGIVKDAFSLWLHEQPAIGNQIAALAIANAQRRLKLSKKTERKRVTGALALPGKLSDCVAQDIQRTELFLVEGDSAGGSAKQARDKEFQAILPLRGKILNTWELSGSEALESQEVRDIALAIGVEPGSTDLSRLRYGKICILADADPDGAHIATLLCALFTRHFKPLVQAGHLFLALPPLFRIDLGQEVFYALDEAEKNGILERIRAEKRRGKPIISRFKGLGEMNPLQLRETTLNPDTRRLANLCLTDTEDPTLLLDKLLGKKRAAERRSWLETQGHLASVAVI